MDTGFATENATTQQLGASAPSSRTGAGSATADQDGARSDEAPDSCLILKNGLIVRSELFKVHQSIGNPISTVERLSTYNVDELVILDISTQDRYDLRRDDLNIRYKGETVLDLLQQIAERCMMPLAFGGRIRTLQDIEARLSHGADKVVVNSALIDDPALITEAARRWGSQCVVASIDSRQFADRYEGFVHNGRTPTGRTPAEFARMAEDLGAGEIFLNNIDRDGTGIGMDAALNASVIGAVSIPVICCGGVGTYAHFAEPLEQGADASAACNIFHFFELSYPLAKEACIDAGIDMRPVRLGGRWFPREPEYDREAEARRHQAREERSFAIRRERSTPRPPPLRWCRKCTLPSISAAPLEFDETGLCSACWVDGSRQVMSEEDWAARLEKLRAIIEKNRCPNGSRHDCVIGVSGGKDSYFQTHVIKNVLGFNPLLVTYYGNNYSEEGHYNLYRMKEVFGVDHIIVQPSVDVLIRLNRLGFSIMGDMNWHNHIGIATMPMKIAARFGIPLVIWGEHGYGLLSGQFSMADFVEFDYRTRLEHYGRSYEWNYFVGLEGLAARDLTFWQYPSDEEIRKVGLRGLFLGNYVPWEATRHGPLMQQLYGFRAAQKKFERTYRLMSNLDDIYENGLHDYLKYVKFGYGRCTDHTAKDIRSGLMTREQGVELVRTHDHVVPSDLYVWLDYTGVKEDDFFRIADTFRDRRVWWKDDNVWKKHNIWD